VSSSRVERSKKNSKRLLLNTDIDVTACWCIPWYARWLLMTTRFQQLIDWWGYEPEPGMNKPRVLLKLSPSVPVTWQTAVLANTLQPASAARSHGDIAIARKARTTHAICVCVTLCSRSSEGASHKLPLLQPHYNDWIWSCVSLLSPSVNLHRYCLKLFSGWVSYPLFFLSPRM